MDGAPSVCLASLLLGKGGGRGSNLNLQASCASKALLCQKRGCGLEDRLQHLLSARTKILNHLSHAGRTLNGGCQIAAFRVLQHCRSLCIGPDFPFLSMDSDPADEAPNGFVCGPNQINPHQQRKKQASPPMQPENPVSTSGSMSHQNNKQGVEGSRAQS